TRRRYCPRLYAFPPRRSSDLLGGMGGAGGGWRACPLHVTGHGELEPALVARREVPVLQLAAAGRPRDDVGAAHGPAGRRGVPTRSEEHTSELQSRENLVCRLL